MNNSEVLAPLQQLRMATKSAHDATEAIAFSNEMRQGNLTIKQYQQLLIRNLYVHQALENAFQMVTHQLPNHPFVPFLDKKSDWLRSDLKQLNNNSYQKHTILPPKYTSLAALVGGLYVVEGSMLGGQYIVKQLAKQRAFSSKATFRFYQGYGTKTGKRWQKFRKIATEVLREEIAIEIAINSAQDTFMFFQKVYSEVR